MIVRRCEPGFGKEPGRILWPDKHIVSSYLTPSHVGVSSGGKMGYTTGGYIMYLPETMIQKLEKRMVLMVLKVQQKG